MGFPRHKYWSGLPFPSQGDPDPGIKPAHPEPLALQADSLLLSCRGSPGAEGLHAKAYLSASSQESCTSGPRVDRTVMGWGRAGLSSWLCRAPYQIFPFSAPDTQTEFWDR